MEAMAKHHTYSIEFKRQVAQEYIAGETLHTLAKRHDLSRNLIRIWVAKYEAGIFEDDARAADLLREYEAKDCRAGTPGRTAGARDRIFKGGIAKRTAAEKREYIRHHRPHSFSVAEGCRLMGLPRSTYYDAPSRRADDAEIIATMMAICDEFEVYGYRRVGAELRHRDMSVNSKKVRRLMREHDLQPKRRRRFMATTDSDHDNPIFPDLARDRVVDGPNQLWVADITYIAIAAGFVYLAASTTRIEARNMHVRLIASCSPTMGSSARWVGAGIPSTMPRQRAS